MSPLGAFQGCWQRLWRAEAHYKSLTENWKRLTEDDPYSVSIRVDPDGAGGIWIIPRYEPLPEIFSLEFGEMLYQLRAALDGCIYAIAVVESDQDPPPDEDALEFPITDSPEKFKNASWHIRPLKDTFRPLIEAIQPYNAPGLSENLRTCAEALRVLHDWARIDRHRRLHLMSSWASRANPALRVPPDIRVVNLTALPGGYLGEERQVAAFQLEGWKPGSYIEANPDLAIGIAVNEFPQPTEPGDNLGRRSANMLSAVESLIQTFEAGLERRSP